MHLIPAIRRAIEDVPPFEHGVAQEKTLELPSVRHLLGLLNQYQAAWLEKDKAWRPGAPPWPRDALNWWSRRWEYVYALKYGLQAGTEESVLDAGSGITFLPYLLDELGCKVLCCDVDPKLPSTYEIANRIYQRRPYYFHADLHALPEMRIKMDVVFCISVLEHMGEWQDVIKGFHRVLKPGGRLVLTCDVDMTDTGHNRIDAYRELVDFMDEGFTVLPRTKWEVDDGALNSEKCHVPQWGRLAIVGITAIRRVRKAWDAQTD